MYEPALQSRMGPSESLERRLEAGVHPATGDAKSIEIHVQTGHFYVAPKELPATDCQNRAILLRFP